MVHEHQPVRRVSVGPKRLTSQAKAASGPRTQIALGSGPATFGAVSETATSCMYQVLGTLSTRTIRGVSFVTRAENPEPPESPEALFRELRPRDPNVRDLLLRQGDALRAYHAVDSSSTDIAIELPTGAGKTLVGLLIAEWRRLAFGQRTAYLCPTVQLANQAAAKAHDYGLDVVNLTGSHRNWDQTELTKYRRHKAVAIASYSTVFNSDPKLETAQTLVLDDAHAAEGPVASTWSISANRVDGALYAELLAAVIDGLSAQVAEPLRDDLLDPYRRWSVELVPPSVVADRVAQIDDALKTHVVEGDQNFFARRAIGGALDRCLMYVSWNEILLRPLIPPTLAHDAFRDAEQRVYMSATLGNAGELERAFGVPQVERIQPTAATEEGGFGRRFFLLPNASNPPTVVDGIVREAISEAGRVAAVGPSFAELDAFTDACLPDGITVLRAEDVEEGLERFVSEERAALLLANRYDGIDLPGDDCRLVVLTGLPANTHLQERFLLETLGARQILGERIRTRFIQGSGRATRSSRDYAAVLIRGEGLTDFCSRDEEVFAMPPQLQAELRFGLDNSENPDQDPTELLHQFWEQGEEWAKADAFLKADTHEQVRREPDGSDALGAAAKPEVLCWRALWGGDLAHAVDLAQEVTDALSGGEELRPYRALWFYLGASWAQQLASLGNGAAAGTAATLLREATGCARSMLWTPALPGLASGTENGGPTPDGRARSVAARLRSLGIRGTRFAARLTEVEEQLGSDASKLFEEGLRGLGELLGFDATRPDAQGDPDGVWRDADRLWLIFEAKSEERVDGALSVSTVRQASTHHKWVQESYGWPEPAQSLTVIVSQRQAIDENAAKVAGEEALVTPDLVRHIAARCVRALRETRAKARGQTDEQLVEQIAGRFAADGLDTDSLLAELGARRVRGGAAA
jgi:Helicase C-terminal domain/DEAD/DEAH box helicase